MDIRLGTASDHLLAWTLANGSSLRGLFLTIHAALQ